MIGVDYDLFWRLNPKTLSPFIKAFSLKQKYDDAMAWQAGLYIRLAVASNFNKEAKYPKRPFSSKESIEEQNQEEIKRRFMERMEQLNSRFKKGGVD